MRALLVALCCSCHADPPAIDSSWDPATGRGVIRLASPAGDRVEVRLHQGFDGYTGGLVLGAMNGSAYRWWPAGDDGEGQAVWCAQDESLLLHRQGAPLEYSHGWSENVGSGPDGVPLRYQKGAIVESSDDHLLLSSTHAALPFGVVRWLLVRPDGTLLFRVRVLNIGSEALIFDFWTGEDPWVGEYGTSDGDVGWVSTAEGSVLVTDERAVSLERQCLGIADVQDGRLTSANAFCLAPGDPPPDHVLFANRFAHGPADIEVGRPLDSDTLTAFNLGWTDIALAPGETFDLTYALGVADVSAGFPRPPVLAESDLALLRRQVAPAIDASPDPLRFASERVVMEVLAGGQEVEVRGRYTFENTGDEPVHRRIFFPFAVDDAHPRPHDVRVQGRSFRRLRDGIVFSVDVPANDRTDVVLSYRQRSLDGTATYIVTSATAWGAPLDRAELVVVAAEGVDVQAISYPLGDPGEGGERAAVFERFFPDREFVVSWAAE